MRSVNVWYFILPFVQTFTLVGAPISRGKLVTVTTSRSDDVRRRDYQPKWCWYGLKIGPTKKDVVPCNLDARLYRVERSQADAGFGLRTTPGQGPSMELWLCENHKFSMQRDGFDLTLIR